MKIRLTPRATTELEDLLTHIEADSLQNAKMVADRIKRTFELIAYMPSVGKPSVRPNVREYIIPKLPLIVVYRPQNDELVVLSVFHTSRDPKLKNN